MSEDFGNGVSRTLSAKDRAYQVVVWQANKPPLDSELNLIMQADWERLAEKVRSEMPSGFLLDPFQSDKDFVTDEDWANWFKLGRPASGEASPIIWANVNGWMVPVAGTALSGDDPSNRVNLWAPPSSDARIDLVFLEVWLASVAPNPSTVNKPSASTIFKYGNAEFGGTNITDDLQDPELGFETTERVQLQYRLRVFGKGTGLGESVDLSTYPDGLDDPNVLAQGAADDPQVGITWANMKDTLGDAGLWRAGDGDPTNALGTIDGYSYAIPVAAIFRRNTGGFVARTTSGNARQNGALNRNPKTAASSTPSEDTRTFTTVTLTSAIDEAATGAIQVDGLSSSGLDNSDLDWDSVFLQIDDEVIRIESVSTATSPGTITIRASGGRGRNGTQAAPHDAGAAVQFFNFRPDGKFADQVLPDDILDLRKGVTPGEWDYEALLAHNLGKLFTNELKTSYKQSGAGDTEGPVVVEVDTLYANGGTSVPNQTEALDGPDGIRTVFSDASVVQSDVSVILNPATGSPGVATAVADFTAGAGNWGPAAAFVPDGFQPDGDGWSNQAVINLYIGGATGNGGARNTVRGSENRIVRFVTPKEYWQSRDEISSSAAIGESGNQYPVLLRLIEEGWSDPAGADEASSGHPGPLFPLPEFNFERPFIFLGGIVNENLESSAGQAIAAGSSPSGLSQIRVAGLDFDTAGVWYPTGDVTSLSVTGVTQTLLHGTRTLFDMLTNGGQDLSGASSELYLVLTGDTTNAANNGVWRVVGCGTVGYTTESGATAADMVVERVGEGSSALVAATGLDISVRSQYTHTEDGDVAGEAAAVVVITDLAGAGSGTSFPWDGLITAPSSSQAVLDTTLLYGPSRGGTARVANKVLRAALSGVDSAELVREAPTALDATFESEAGVPDGEVYFPLEPIQAWNRLPSLGLSAPRAPDYGEDSYWGEQRREAEVFVDAGSKTLMVRPFQRTDLTLVRYRATAGATNRFFPQTYTAGDFSGGAVDGGNIFAADADYAYAFPPEFMPRFGRQDIPFHQTTGTTGPVFYGINHLFGDSQTDTDDVFRVVGGPDNSSAVESIFFQTGPTSGRDYGEYFTLAGTAKGYQARVYEDVNVISSDMPKGLKGIQLPPFLGIARLYGVYDLREFAGSGAFDSDRVTVSAAPGRPTNLLRTDVDKQTLFIVRGGGEDVTGNANDHTYVIPSTNIDVRRSGSYVAGETFDDLEFVVECVIFGFGRGFINLNNYIMMRRNLPNRTAGTAATAVATEVSCILPLPLPYNEQMYVVYDRTVYQGDPYMTRDGTTKTVSDYEHRYGQIPSSSSVELATAIQQYDSTNDYAQVPTTQNARAFEVLAALDFSTTLGTGKIGGRTYKGTALDVGYLDSATRIAATSSSPPFQANPRAFSEPQPLGAIRASLTLRVKQASATSAGESVVIKRGSLDESLVSNSDFSGGSASAVASDLADTINASDFCQRVALVRAIWGGGETITLVSLLPGETGHLTTIALSPKGGQRSVSGFEIASSQYSVSRRTNAPLEGGKDTPMNAVAGSWVVSPAKMTGLTERLPLGILLQDSDFLGEDPMRNGTSALVVGSNGGSAAPSQVAPIQGTEEFGRLQGAGQIGMADGSILQYQAWTLAQPSGTKGFRLFRGGGSAYVLDPTPAGGPLDFSAGALPEGAEPVLKGGILAGRAFLVRNFEEEAYSSPQTRSHGGEVQMVIVTQGVLGEGPGVCRSYTLDGQISPTGYGEGLAAADRYRIEGKPMVAGHTRTGADPSVPLAAFPNVDEAEDDGC